MSTTISKNKEHILVCLSSSPSNEHIVQVAALVAATLLSLMFFHFGFTDASIMTLYILGVLVTAALTEHALNYE